MYLVWLIPFQYYVVGMDLDMLIKWLWIGTLSEIVVAYPIGKIFVKYTPRITAWCVKQ